MNERKFHQLEIKHFRNLDHYELSINHCRSVAREYGKWSAKYFKAREKRFAFALDYHETLEQVDSEAMRLYCQGIRFGALLYQTPSHYFIS